MPTYNSSAKRISKNNRLASKLNTPKKNGKTETSHKTSTEVSSNDIGSQHPRINMKRKLAYKIVRRPDQSD
jgi:hypothetical protein